MPPLNAYRIHDEYLMQLIHLPYDTTLSTDLF